MRDPTFHPIPPDQLPRDDALQTGKDLTFRTLEHDQFDAPHAIEVTDKEGRSAVYVLLEVDGVIGRWKSGGEWAIFETEDLASVSEPRSGKSMSGKDAPGSPAKG